MALKSVFSETLTTKCSFLARFAALAEDRSSRGENTRFSTATSVGSLLVSLDAL